MDLSARLSDNKGQNVTIRFIPHDKGVVIKHCV